MTTYVSKLDDESFSTQVLNAPTPVLVDFTATWCPPCRAMEPILEALAEEYAGRIRFASINVDDHQDCAGRYGVRAMPTMLVFQGGRVVKQIVGALPRAKLEATLREVL